MIGHIYKIVHTQSDLTYIGMTLNSLSKRWQEHKQKVVSDNGINNAMIHTPMREYGVDQFKMMLIKSYEVIDRNHLKVYESLWINKLNCINKVPSFNPMSKKQQDHSSYMRNREERLEKVKAYAAANKDLIKERTKLYREKNKDVIKEKKSERFDCECGGTWSKGHGKARHDRTKKHITWLESQN